VESPWPVQGLGEDGVPRAPAQRGRFGGKRRESGVSRLLVDARNPRVLQFGRDRRLLREGRGGREQEQKKKEGRIMFLIRGQF